MFLFVYQEECIIRYKMLAELVQKRKQAKSWSKVVTSDSASSCCDLWPHDRWIIWQVNNQVQIRLTVSSVLFFLFRWAASWLDWIIMSFFFMWRGVSPAQVWFYNSCQRKQKTSLNPPDLWPHSFMCLSSVQHAVNQLLFNWSIKNIYYLLQFVFHCLSQLLCFCVRHLLMFQPHR